MKCPSEETLLRLQLGEISVNLARSVEGHVALCPACQSLLSSQRQLLEDLAAKDADLEADEAFVQRVLNSCVKATPAHREDRWGRWIPWTTTFAVAAAAVLCVGGYLLSGGRHRNEFAARRAAHSDSSNEEFVEVGAEVLVVHGSTSLPVQGASARPGDGFAIRYWNKTRQTKYLAAFAMDAKGVVHWLYPAYSVAGSEPVSVPLLPSEARLLDDVVEPDAPEPGEMQVVVIVSTSQLEVKTLDIEVERDGFDALIRRISGEASVKQWHCTWSRE